MNPTEEIDDTKRAVANFLQGSALYAANDYAKAVHSLLREHWAPLQVGSNTGSSISIVVAPGGHVIDIAVEPIEKNTSTELDRAAMKHVESKVSAFPPLPQMFLCPIRFLANFNARGHYNVYPKLEYRALRKYFRDDVVPVVKKTLWADKEMQKKLRAIPDNIIIGLVVDQSGQLERVQLVHTDNPQKVEARCVEVIRSIATFPAPPIYAMKIHRVLEIGAGPTVRDSILNDLTSF